MRTIWYSILEIFTQILRLVGCLLKTFKYICFWAKNKQRTWPVQKCLHQILLLSISLFSCCRIFCRGPRVNLLASRHGTKCRLDWYSVYVECEATIWPSRVDRWSRRHPAMHCLPVCQCACPLLLMSPSLRLPLLLPMPLLPLLLMLLFLSNINAWSFWTCTAWTKRELRRRVWSGQREQLGRSTGEMTRRLEQEMRNE